MEILERLQLRLRDGENVPDDDVLEDCIETAKAAIMNRRFPYGEWPDEVETRYQDLQFRIAMDLYNKIGAEGELSHSENGISRQFESSWVSEQLLSEVTPYCGAVK